MSKNSIGSFGTLSSNEGLQRRLYGQIWHASICMLFTHAGLETIYHCMVSLFSDTIIRLLFVPSVQLREKVGIHHSNAYTQATATDRNRSFIFVSRHLGSRSGHMQIASKGRGKNGPDPRE